jgi:F-type H+-transporting ATPase subunit a
MNIELNGAKILATLHTGFLGDIQISQTMVMSWIILGVISLLCWWLGHDLKVDNISKRQAAAEYIIEMLDSFAHGSMSEKFDRYIPLVGALFATSVVSNLISLVGFWSPTADLATEAAWAVVVFILITYHKIKASGFGGYLKGYLFTFSVKSKNIFIKLLSVLAMAVVNVIMLPINLISEAATPVSMACRHFGNILSGMVISTLIYAALAAASAALLGALSNSIAAGLIVLAFGALMIWLGSRAKKMPRKIFGVVLLVLGAFGLLTTALPAAGSLPILDVGIPAVTSLYFDWFSGCIQAFIFCTLTMIFIQQASGEEE